MSRMLAFAMATLVLGYSSFTCARADEIPDGSLTPEDYIQRGLPPLDRPWTVADYDAAERVLLGMRIGQLPHSSSPRSRAVIEKLTDPRNLDIYADRAIALHTRLAAIEELAMIELQFARPYAASTILNAAFENDVFELGAFFLQTLVVRFDLQDELATSLAGRNQPSATDMERLQQERAGLGPSIHGLCKMLQDRDDSNNSGRAYLARAISAAYPKLAYRLPADAQAELDATVHDVARNDPSAEVRAALSSFAPGG